ncbi:hypothetical protein Q3W71_12545 [Micromonospora sp. C28SCA-DRY-2]|uniref:hypothetical protein n=1 Tax=Micromonospora sp. C28SCA-DRY-2 TaxID=3059522 RepID=UPI0026774C02|nr:hypothetical protein [Micromonospora sp. C28SCA-DRY-2]MDO3702503.1 hypothetical protein [Micromonospora sp. C28SCA-DRY-2]
MGAATEVGVERSASTIEDAIGRAAVENAKSPAVAPPWHQILSALDDDLGLLRRIQVGVSICARRWSARYWIARTASGYVVVQKVVSKGVGPRPRRGHR